MIAAKLLQLCRQFYSVVNPRRESTHRNWSAFSVKQYANDLISEALDKDDPLMISRLGSSELACLENFRGVCDSSVPHNCISYIKGNTPAWWWNQRVIDQLHRASGFFPPDEIGATRFCELMIQDIKQIDILGSWLRAEQQFAEELQNSKYVVLEDIEPFFCNRPWTWGLRGKKVLVVHPFDKTIESQYRKRSQLFPNDLLPEFELSTLRSVQSIAGEKTPFRDWFSALDHMKKEVEAREFDVCIIGCGAYGLPLAAHVKRIGRKAIHLGGVTQLLFGIIGKRWETYIVYPYKNLFNEHWVRPKLDERPRNAGMVEKGCYW